MAKQNINVGTAANDKKGDSLRAAFVKVNANFTELYTELGLVNDVTLSLGAFEFAGSTLSTTDSTAIVIDQATTITSNLSVGGDLLPQTALGGDLGSSTLPWRSLYVSNNTIYIGGTAVGLDANGNLTTGGTVVGSTPAWANITGKPTFATVATTGAYADLTGKPTIPTLVSQLSNDSGFLTSVSNIQSESDVSIEINLSDSTLRRWQFGEDGNLTLPQGGNISEGGGITGAIKLTPAGGANEYQALVIYPTAGEGDHIHLTAGGGTTELYLGNDLHYVKLASDGNIRIQADNGVNGAAWTFGTDGSLQIPGDISSEGNINIDINLGDSTLRRWSFGEDGILTLPSVGKISNGAYDWTFGTNGELALPNNGKITSGVDAAQVGSTTTIALNDQGTDQAYDVTYLGINWTGNEAVFTTYAAGSTITFANGDVRTINDIQKNEVYGFPGEFVIDIYWSASRANLTAFPITLKTFNYAAAYTAPEWRFGTDGSLTLPNGSVIKDTDGYAVAIGDAAGYSNQGSLAVAVGAGAGYNSQGTSAVAIGRDAGGTAQGINAVAIGDAAGGTAQGINAIAIGIQAGYANQAANSIIINATGATLNQTIANTFTVKPVRQGETANAMYYNTSTGEITYSDIFSFSVAADDSTQRAISNNELIKFIGAGTVTTASDAEGNITITGSGGGTSIPTVVTTGAVGVGGQAHVKVQFTVASATTVTAVGVTVIGISTPASGQITLSGSPGTGSFDIVAATNVQGSTFILMPFATNASGTGYGAPIAGTGTDPCLVRGTMITMADMSRVAVENITYSDDILVWDFDLGDFASAKPLWIKKTQTTVVSCLLTFSDHSELRIVGDSPKAHRIFNKEAGRFTYGSMPETPIGTTTFNDQGEEITLISKEWIVGEVEFYNVMTDYHMNLFANSILTSMRYNNLYPITDMKFVKDSRTLRTADDYPNVEERLYKGFRLAEQTHGVEEIETHIQWLLTLEVERETECV